MHQHVSVQGTLGAENFATDGAGVGTHSDCGLSVVGPDVFGQLILGKHNLGAHRTHVALTLSI